MKNYKRLIMKNIIVGIFIVLGAFGTAEAQEMLVGLERNAMLYNAEQQIAKTRKDGGSLTLPFFDDFSNYGGRPQGALWADGHAFVNGGYGVFPPTVGVATLDALDGQGLLHALAQTSLFPADTLTSNIIRLDSIFLPYPKAIGAEDSVYLSFYYQPGGGYGNMWERVGNAPAYEDSLILEFYDAVALRWNMVWAANGMELDTFLVKNGVFFKHVTVAVTDRVYFTDGFRFRFRNYCSLDRAAKPGLAANTDQWNIDYVYLNTGRSAVDTVVRDIAFVMPAPSFLNHFLAMPARQFRSSSMKTNAEMLITNLYSDVLECNYTYVVEDENGSVIETYSGGHDNILPFYPDGVYQTAEAHAKPPINFDFPVQQQSGRSQTFTVKHIIKNGITGDFHSVNDTVVYSQVFDNYFAYDDGIPENGYGLTSTSSVMWLAYRFDLNTHDTLTAIDMFFNQTMDGVNSEVPFYITVWGDDDGKPGSMLYKSTSYAYPEWGGENGYKRYVLEKPVRVDGTIYIGFEQRSSNFINLGFDRSNDVRQFIFYKTGMEWQQSILAGALMMRPCFGARAQVGIAHNDVDVNDVKLRVYPNPAKDVLKIELNTNIIVEAEQLQMSVYDSYGRCLTTKAFDGELDVSGFKGGVYLLRVVDGERGQLYSAKFIVAK